MKTEERSRNPISPLLVVLYILIVYSTIPFAPYFVDFLKGIFGPYYSAFVSVSIASIIVLIVIKSAKYFRHPRTAFWLVFLSFSAVFVLLTMEIPAERVHFIEYGFLAYLLMRTTRYRKTKVYLFSFGLGAIIGFVDELIQLFFQHQRIFALPRRYFEWKDIGMNIFGVFLGCVFYRYVVEEGRKLEERSRKA